VLAVHVAIGLPSLPERRARTFTHVRHTGPGSANSAILPIPFFFLSVHSRRVRRQATKTHVAQGAKENLLLGHTRFTYLRWARLGRKRLWRLRDVIAGRDRGLLVAIAGPARVLLSVQATVVVVMLHAPGHGRRVGRFSGWIYESTQ
jgi:hypothetical protein